MLTAFETESGLTTRFTYREMASMADRIAIGLVRLGVGRNDVVSMQLPNWWQFTLTYLACSRIGAVLNPLMHIFRERELAFMLDHSESRVLIVPRVFRGFDFGQMATNLRADLPRLEHVVVVGGKGGRQLRGAAQRARVGA
ncbi:Long-chain-fatty-acid-CoA ligase [Candidatus Paraburkholderia schumanniana]|nr:Long-chain-fatty-acid-CoA ligase [Candidatus Paraburkholderia schumannianae]